MEVELLLSLIGAPIAGVILLFFTKGVVTRWLRSSASHLLIRSLQMRWTLCMGFCLCALSLLYNYTLCLQTLISVFTVGIETEEKVARVAIVMADIFLAIFLLPRVIVRYKHLNAVHQIELAYTLTLTLVLCNILLPLLTTDLPPILVLSTQVMVINTLLLRSDKPSYLFTELLTAIGLPPILAGFFCLTELNFAGDIYQLIFTLLLLLIGGLVVKSILHQRNEKQRIQAMLKEEQEQRKEANNELHRKNMQTVASHFYAMSGKMELKRKELIDLALHIKRQRDYMENVSTRLKEISEENDIEQMRTHLKEQITEMGESMKLSEDMDRFYTEVDAMHRHFVSKLMMRCATLTEQERRLAILLRLGLSSKEIASLLSIAPKSVEIARYRLRKKLELERDDNLVQYIQLL